MLMHEVVLSTIHNLDRAHCLNPHSPIETLPHITHYSERRRMLYRRYPIRSTEGTNVRGKVRGSSVSVLEGSSMRMDGWRGW